MIGAIETPEYEIYAIRYAHGDRRMTRPSPGTKSEPGPGVAGRVIKLPQGRVVGGSSAINGMVYNRGHAEDFDDWEALGCTGWGYRDVLPYFRRSAPCRRASGSIGGG